MNRALRACAGGITGMCGQACMREYVYTSMLAGVDAGGRARQYRVNTAASTPTH
jgi:hypothetical protein